MVHLIATISTEGFTHIRLNTRTYQCFGKYFEHVVIQRWIRGSSAPRLLVSTAERELRMKCNQPVPEQQLKQIHIQRRFQERRSHLKHSNYRKKSVQLRLHPFAEKKVVHLVLFTVHMKLLKKHQEDEDKPSVCETVSSEFPKSQRERI